MMSQTPELEEPGPPSPVALNDVIAERFVVGPRIGVRGDVHLHHGSFRSPQPGAVAEQESVRIAAFRYRGAEPLPRFLELLRQDGEAWGRLRSVDGRLPVIVPTLEVGRQVNTLTCYWIQEDPRGPSLAEKLDQPLAPRYALHLAMEAGTALRSLHEVGLVHGDLDPSHVHLLGNLDTVRLTWGGLAHRLESAGMDAGRGSNRSLSEVAPEVLQGRWNDPRSDLYALAALLYRMLGGQPPWLVRKRGPLPGATLDDPPPPLPEWVKPELTELITAALQRDPARRPDLGEWLERLSRVDELYLDDYPPEGTFWPTMPVGPEPLPPTLNRTLSPIERLDEQDPALSNTPAPTQRTLTPRTLTPRLVGPGHPHGMGSHGMGALGQPPHTLPPGALRSVVPAPARAMDHAAPAPVHLSSGSLSSWPPPVTPLPAPGRRPFDTPMAFLLPVSAFGMLGFGLGLLMLAVLWISLSPPGRLDVPAPAPEQAATAQAPATRAIFEVRSDPPGAELWEGSVLLGKTPVEVPLTGQHGDPPREFQLKLEGYATTTIRQTYSPTPVRGFYDLQPLTPQDAPAPQSQPQPAPAPRGKGPKPAPQLELLEERR